MDELFSVLRIIRNVELHVHHAVAVYPYALACTILHSMLSNDFKTCTLEKYQIHAQIMRYID